MQNTRPDRMGSLYWSGAGRGGLGVGLGGCSHKRPRASTVLVRPLVPGCVGVSRALPGRSNRAKGEASSQRNL